MNYDILYEAWKAVGADIAGLEWSKFVDSIEEQLEKIGE